jgi:hypothetical protein
MKKYRFLLFILGLTGKLALIGLSLRDRFRPIFPLIRSTIGMRKELRGILREVRRINTLIHH